MWKYYLKWYLCYFYNRILYVMYYSILYQCGLYAILIRNGSFDRRRQSKQLGSSSRFSSGRRCSCWSGRSARGNFPTYGSIWGYAKQVSATLTYRVKLCLEAAWLPRRMCVHTRVHVITVSDVYLPGKPRFRKPVRGVVTRRPVTWAWRKGKSSVSIFFSCRIILWCLEWSLRDTRRTKNFN